MLYIATRGSKEIIILAILVSLPHQRQGRVHSALPTQNKAHKMVANEGRKEHTDPGIPTSNCNGTYIPLDSKKNVYITELCTQTTAIAFASISKPATKLRQHKCKTHVSAAQCITYIGPMSSMLVFSYSRATRVRYFQLPVYFNRHEWLLVAINVSYNYW